MRAGVAMRFGMFKSVDQSRVSGERLTVPLSLEDGTVPGIARGILNFSAVLVLILIVWASFAEMRELAIAQGSLVPSGSEIAVEHLEGGIIEEIMVSEGELVDAGTLLMRLRAVASSSDLEQLTARVTSLKFQNQRIAAGLAGAAPDFGALGTRFPAIAANQHQIYLSQRQLEQSRGKVAAARIDQKKAELAALRIQRESSAQQLEIQREQLSIRQEVLREGFTSRKDFLESKSRFGQARSDLAAIDGRLAASLEALAEAQSYAAETQAEGRRKILEEKARVSTELAEAEQGVRKFQDRNDRLDIRSPIRGAVKELATKGIGKVLRPGDVAARIVPLGDRVIAEVQVQPRDISYVTPGLEAEITVTALDPNIHGKLEGKVARVSPSTFQTEAGETYYRAIIELDTETNKARKLPVLIPGMVVQANIVTGSKSIMRYLLKPVVRSLDSAFGER